MLLREASTAKRERNAHEGCAGVDLRGVYNRGGRRHNTRRQDPSVRPVAVEVVSDVSQPLVEWKILGVAAEQRGERLEAAGFTGYKEEDGLRVQTRRRTSRLPGLSEAIRVSGRVAHRVTGFWFPS